MSSKAIHVPRSRSGHLDQSISRTWIYNVDHSQRQSCLGCHRCSRPRKVSQKSIHNFTQLTQKQTTDFTTSHIPWVSILHMQSNYVAKHTRIKVHDSSALLVFVWQNSNTTAVIDLFHRVGRYVTNHIRIAGSDCVVVDQQLVSMVIIKFTSSQKS